MNTSNKKTKRAIYKDYDENAVMRCQEAIIKKYLKIDVMHKVQFSTPTKRKQKKSMTLKNQTLADQFDEVRELFGDKTYYIAMDSINRVLSKQLSN